MNGAPLRLLSVVIPARNESGCIAETIQGVQVTLTEAGIAHEIVVVDDGSCDGTWDLLVALALQVKELKPFQNHGAHGFGRAVTFGLDRIAGDAAVIVMADASENPADIVRYWELLGQGYDCVFGSRFIPGGTTVDYPKLKWCLNRIANTLVRLLFNIALNDTTNAFKAYRRWVIEACRPLDAAHFDLTLELPLKALARGARWVAVPVSWHNRKTGISKLHIAEMAPRYLLTCLAAWRERHVAAAPDWSYLAKAARRRGR